MRQVTDATDPTYLFRLSRRSSANVRRSVLPGGSGVSFEASRAGFPPSPTLCCWDWPLVSPSTPLRSVVI